MQPKTFLVLGGYGNSGLALARLLLRFSDCRLVLAGRNLQRAEAAAAGLNAEFSGMRVKGIRLDATDTAALKPAFAGMDMAVAASSTARCAGAVAAAALEAGSDYLDIQLSSEEKLAALNALRPQILNAGRCFITDGGFHPGLPAVMIRHAAQQFDRLTSANIGSLLKVNWADLHFSEATLREFADEITREIANPRPAIYRDKMWRKAGMFSAKDYPAFDFGTAFGKRRCAPMFLEEMRYLPEMFPALQETAFYVSGFNWFVDGVVFPLLMAGVKIHPQGKFAALGNLLIWGLRRFSQPPYNNILKLEARGEKAGKPAYRELRISHEDGYLLTAAPVAACLLQYLDGTIRQPGLWLMAHLVEPGRLLEDLVRMGISVEWKKGEPAEKRVG